MDTGGLNRFARFIRSNEGSTPSCDDYDETGQQYDPRQSHHKPSSYTYTQKNLSYILYIISWQKSFIKWHLA